MFTRIIKKKVDARIAEVLLSLPENIVAQIKPILVDTLKEGHTDLAGHYLHLRRQHDAMRAAYTAVVGADSTLSERGVNAYFKTWHQPKSKRFDDQSWAVKQLLDRMERDD